MLLLSKIYKIVKISRSRSLTLKNFLNSLIKIILLSILGKVQIKMKILPSLEEHFKVILGLVEYA